MRGRHDEQGAVLVLVVASMVMILGAAGLSMAVGQIVVGNRSLQGLSDTVAMDAVTLLDGRTAGQLAGAVDQEALAAALRNGFSPSEVDDNVGNSTPEAGPAGHVLTVVFGTWTPPAGATTTTAPSSTTTSPSPTTTTTSGGDPSVGTFTPVTDPTAVPDALQIQARSTVGMAFVGGTRDLYRSATADDVAIAGASIGSWLASVDPTQGTVLNGLLSTLNGIYDTSSVAPSVSLTAAGYQGLADTSVTLGDIASADPDIGTVDNLLSGTWSPGVLSADLAKALDDRSQKELSRGDVTAATNLEQASASVSHIAGLVTVTTGIDVCRMVSVAAAPPAGSPQDTGPSFSCNPQGGAAGTATVNVLRFIEGVAELALADGQNAFSVDLGVGSKVTLTASVVQPARELSPCAPGPACTVSTDQVAVSLETQVDASTSLQVTSSAADASATLTSVTCANGQQYPDTTGYQVTTTGATLAATVTNGLLGTFGAEDGLPGYSGTLSWAQTPPPPPGGASVFTPADGQSVSAPAPTVAFPTFTPALPALLSGAVGTALGTLDPQLPDVLTALGASVEGATVTSWPVDCSAPQLVQ